jgi:hypothetical protein
VNNKYRESSQIRSTSIVRERVMAEALACLCEQRCDVYILRSTLRSTKQRAYHLMNCTIGLPTILHVITRFRVITACIAARTVLTCAMAWRSRESTMQTEGTCSKEAISSRTVSPLNYHCVTYENGCMRGILMRRLRREMQPSSAV